ASQNGTYINEKPISRCRLADGDKIRLGASTVLEFISKDAIHEAPPPPEEPEMGADEYFLLAVGTQLGTIPLPPSGRVTIGRAHSCDVQLDDESLPDIAAVLEVGPPLRIEAVGDADVLLQDRTLKRHEPELLHVGQLLTMGGVRLVVQKRPSASLRL